jgi:hypothetical protein
MKCLNPMDSRVRHGRFTIDLIHFQHGMFVFQAVIRFDGGKWVNQMVDKNGKVSTLTRYVDQDDMQQLVSCLLPLFLCVVHSFIGMYLWIGQSPPMVQTRRVDNEQ